MTLLALFLTLDCDFPVLGFNGYLLCRIASFLILEISRLVVILFVICTDTELWKAHNIVSLFTFGWWLGMVQLSKDVGNNCQLCY